MIKHIRSSMAIADRYLVKLSQAMWNSWTVQKSVTEGYSASGWVYAAVRQIVQAASNIPLVVYRDGEIIPEHHLSLLLAKPSRSISGQDFIELIVSWLELTGRAPFKKIIISGQSKELQLISPDRIAPIASKDVDMLVQGYALDDGNSIALMPEEVCYLKLIDPSNPLNGIGPLQAAARAVDCDNEQQDWNKSAMENRGIIDGVFTFKEKLDYKTGDAILQRIKEKFGSAGKVREPLVIGSDATYSRMGMTAVEADFIESRKFNREEIFNIFNVPIALAAGDTMTYNNYATAMRILYESNVLPLIDDICSELNFSFDNELRDNEYIGPDLSNVDALKDQDAEKITSAKGLWDIGVPVSVINERLELGINEFPNWDAPWSGFPPRAQQPMQIQSAQRAAGFRLRTMEERSIDSEIADREKIASTSVDRMFSKLLREQRQAVETALNQRQDPIEAIKSTRGDWVQTIDAMAQKLALHFSASYIMTRDGSMPHEVRITITDEIGAYLLQEGYALNDYSKMEQTTIDAVIEQVTAGLENNRTIAEIMQAIDDVGSFGPVRSLMLSRTLTGTAQNIGQISAAKAAGATGKTWLTAGDDHVRDPLHSERNGVRVGIDETWNNNPGFPMRFPMDPKGTPGDRINCRCVATFDMN